MYDFSGFNVQQQSLSWITFEYTGHLHTTVRVRWKYHLNNLLMWITMSSVFETVFLAWDSVRVILDVSFGKESGLQSDLMLSSQPVKGFSYFLGPRWLKLTPKENFKSDPGCIQGVIHAMRVFFCRSTTSHENKVVNFQTQEVVLCDWVSSKISGTHICCILFCFFLKLVILVQSVEA